MTNDIEATLNLNSVLNGYGYGSQTAHKAQRQLDLELSDVYLHIRSVIQA